MAKAKILVIDDESGVRELLCDALRLSDYDVSSAVDGADALSVIQNQSFDLLIVDVNMPRLDGYQLTRKLRDGGNQTPVIYVTARDEKRDISEGLRSGADDYITKPFGLEELTLRVAAVLRRTKPAETVKPVLLSYGPITIDIDHYEVHVNGQLTELSPTEFRLLHFLVSNPGKVLTKRKLFSEVWGMDFETNSTVLDTYISYLRKHLKEHGFEGIRTVRGIGFQILADE
ncbi:MAG: hypothetical protein RLZZ426_1241 [Actinomycetota bacterium]|jgi:two-component system OmpR family response regulator